MEPFNAFIGEGEDFSSNESGWTKYLASPSQDKYASIVVDGEDDDDNYCSYNRVSHKGYRSNKFKDEVDDDSFASDASSGPSHHEMMISRGMIEGGGCRSDDYEQGDEGEEYTSRNKVCFGHEKKPCNKEEAKRKAGKGSKTDSKGKKTYQLWCKTKER